MTPCELYQVFAVFDAGDACSVVTEKQRGWYHTLNCYQTGRVARSLSHSLTRILCYRSRAGIDKHKLEKGRGRAHLNEDISFVSKSV